MNSGKKASCQQLFRELDILPVQLDNLPVQLDILPVQLDILPVQLDIVPVQSNIYFQYFHFCIFSIYCCTTAYEIKGKSNMRKLIKK
jgi:hypothetical protein